MIQWAFQINQINWANKSGQPKAIENPNISFFSDYKSSLQEFVQTEQKSVEYIITNEEGPAHNKTFTVDAIIEGIVYGTGMGSSKKEAEQEAAKVALEKLAIRNKSQ